MDDRYRDNLEEEELESGESFEPQFDGDDGSSSDMEGYEESENTGVSRRVDQFSSGYNPMPASGNADVDAINNRAGRNEPVGRRNDVDQTGRSSRGGRGLGKKDGLEDKDGLDKDKKGKDDKSSGKNGKDQGKGKGKGKGKAPLKGNVEGKGNGKKKKTPKQKFKELMLKLKIIGIIALILGGIASLIFTIALFIGIFETFLSAVSSFFGIKDSSTTSEPGLVDDNQYEGMTDSELIDYLKEDNTCTKITWWNQFTDWATGNGFDASSAGVCKLLRYIETTVKDVEDKKGIDLDRSLVLSTIFHGFAAQATYDNYYQIPSGEGVGAENHFDSLISVLQDGHILKKQDIKTIVNHTYFDTTYFKKEGDGKANYYTWVIREELKNPNNPDSDTELVAYCEPTPIGTVQYSSWFWQLFMRYGEDRAKEYRDIITYKAMYDGTEPECNGEAELPTGTYDRLDGSVTTARNLFKGEGKPKSTVGYDQFADIQSPDKDNLTFSYEDGFAYIKFPLYKKAIEDPNINITWDDVLTPKRVEHTINDALSKKSDFNQILKLKDMDNLVDYSLVNSDGYITTGAFCGEYLSAPLNEITVELKDCDGQVFASTDFKDYIIGVVYAEVGGAADNPNYAKTQMAAAISYSINRHNNYQKGSRISMRSGNCDQVYCCPNKGCHSKSSNINCGGFKCTSYVNGANSSGKYWKGKMSDSTYTILSSYYDEVSQFLIVDESAKKVFSAHYVSTYQNRWENLAKQGYEWTTILQNEYSDEGASVIKCADLDTTVINDPAVETPDGEKQGNKASSSYPNVSPDKGVYYGFAYKQPDPSNRDINIDPAWVSANITTITAECKAAGWTQKMTVHKKSVPKWEAANNKICELLTKGVTIDGKECVLNKSDLKFGGAFVQRKTSSGGFSLHGYGMAADWNYSSEYTINGTKYKPYASMGSSTYSAYQSFVRALGKEEDCRNINYILWKYAYKPTGFKWGGSWSQASFDPMHFEVDYK